MPLQHLVDTFNDRFIAENQFGVPPLAFDGERVHGRLGTLAFTSRLKPVRLYADPERITGHDTAPLVFSPASADDATRLRYGETLPNIVSLDRLSRTVHMLNYLILDRPEGHLFLHVHPHHVLTVKKDHGAYFEDIIRRCGLPLRRVVIGLTLCHVYESHILLLLTRLQAYRERGYATALNFSELIDSRFVERFRRQFLHRFPPDYMGFDVGFIHRSQRNPGEQRRLSTLFSAIRQVDTQILVANIRSATDHDRIRPLRPDYVQGSWYAAANGYTHAGPGERALLPGPQGRPARATRTLGTHST